METVLKNLKGFFFACIIFILSTLIVSAAVRFTAAPEGWSLYYMIGALCFTCFFLGLYFGNLHGKKGLIYGVMYSVIFLLVLSSFRMLAFSTGIETDAGLIKYLIPVFAGSIGGMAGVNMRG
jgi:putative membrane protein (TIGR04086 family)